jgi:hypothetical protein
MRRFSRRPSTEGSHIAPEQTAEPPEPVPEGLRTHSRRLQSAGCSVRTHSRRLQSAGIVPTIAAAAAAGIICAAALCLAAPQARRSLPPAERITDTLYRIGHVTVDTAARTATCRGEINMNGGPIEYLAVGMKGKRHESLLALDVRPLHLQLALLLLGLDPKNVLKSQGERRAPEGDPVTLRVRWRDSAGKRHDVRAEELVMRMPGRHPMPRHEWVFTGSRISEAGFEADLDESIVAVWHDPVAILDNPLVEGGDNSWEADPSRSPPRGTSVELVVVAPPRPASAAGPNRTVTVTGRP